MVIPDDEQGYRHYAETLYDAVTTHALGWDHGLDEVSADDADVDAQVEQLHDILTAQGTEEIGGRGGSRGGC